MLNGSPRSRNGPLNGWGRLLGLVGVPGAISKEDADPIYRFAAASASTTPSP